MVYGKVAWTGVANTNSENFFWIPLLGPLVGGALAALVYSICVMNHWPEARQRVQVRDSEAASRPSEEEKL